MHDPAKSRQRKESDRLIPQSMIPAVRISVLASSSVIAPPFKTFPVRFKICSQLLFIVKHSFFILRPHGRVLPLSYLTYHT